jgi:hypothetical protein
LFLACVTIPEIGQNSSSPNPAQPQRTFGSAAERAQFGLCHRPNFLVTQTAWSSFAHAAAMSILGLELASQWEGFLVGLAALVVSRVALIALAPAKSVARVSAAVCVASRSGRALNPTMNQGVQF